MSDQESKQQSETCESLPNKYLPNWATGISLVILVVAVAYKVITSPLNLQMDFTAVLSLFLALFAVWLSALFYFKATESSNNFYENTYRHTKDIAQLLTRIESGFGERLRHLDEGYTSMRDRFVQSPMVATAKQEIKEEEQHIEEKIKERETLIAQLLEKTQLQQTEKQQFMSELAAKDGELKSAVLELTRLRAALDREEETASIQVPGFLSSYLVSTILPKLGLEERTAHAPLSILMKRFSRMEPEHSDFYRDMEKCGFTDENRALTSKGAIYLKNLAKKNMKFTPKNNE